MLWQDIIIIIGNIFLSYGLVFQVYRNFKHKSCAIEYYTAIGMFVGMTLVTIAIFGIGLIYSGIINAGIASLWLVVFLQKLFYGRT